MAPLERRLCLYRQELDSLEADTVGWQDAGTSNGRGGAAEGGGSSCVRNCVSWACAGFLRAEPRRAVGLAWIREKPSIFAVVGVIQVSVGEPPPV